MTTPLYKTGQGTSEVETHESDVGPIGCAFWHWLAVTAFAWLIAICAVWGAIDIGRLLHELWKGQS